MPASLRVKVEAMRAGLPTSKKLLRPTFQGPWTNLGSIWLIWGEWLVKSHLETECVSQKEVFNDSALTYSVSWTDPNSSNSKNYPTWCLSQIWRFILRPLTHRCDAVCHAVQAEQMTSGRALLFFLFPRCRKLLWFLAQVMAYFILAKPLLLFILSSVLPITTLISTVETG